MDQPTVTPTTASVLKQQKIKKLSGFVNYIFGGLETLLLIRFIFKALGARSTNAFVSLLYQITSPFILSFSGIFGHPPSIGLSVIETETIIAAIIYGLAWFGLLQLVKTLLD